MNKAKGDTGAADDPFYRFQSAIVIGGSEDLEPKPLICTHLSCPCKGNALAVSVHLFLLINN